MPIVPLVLIAILALLIFAGSSHARSKDGSPTSTTPVVTVQRMESLSKAQLEKMLADLEKKKVPVIKLGAMCYKPAPSPQRAEYVCPVCGEKTLYAADMARLVEWELQGCRRDADEIKKASKGAITLDESSLCRKCSPSTTTHDLALKVAYADGAKHTASPVNSQDLRLVREFLKGGNSYTTSNDGELPLKSQAPRLRELLGLAQDTTAKK